MRMFRFWTAFLAMSIIGLGVAFTPTSSKAQYIGHKSFIAAGLTSERISPINGAVTSPTTTFMFDGQLMIGSLGDQLYLSFSSSQSASTRGFVPQQGIAADNLGSIGRVAFGVAPEWGNVAFKLGATYTTVSAPDSSVVGMLSGNMYGAEAEVSASFSPGDSAQEARMGYTPYTITPFARAEMYAIPQTSGTSTTATYISAGLASEVNYPLYGNVVYGLRSSGGARWFARTSAQITHDPGAMGLDNGFLAMASARSGFSFGAFEIGAQYQYAAPVFGGGLGVLNYAASSAGYNGLPGSAYGYGYGGNSYYGSQSLRPQAAGAAGIYMSVRF